MIKKMCGLLTSALMAFAFVVALSSCVSTSVESSIPELTKYDDALLWEINGTDSEGNSSKLYVLGTIHFGDDRLYPLPQSVESAFESSDKYVAELSSEDFGKMVPELVARQVASMGRETARAAETGKPLLSYFTEDEINFFIQVYGSIEIVNQLALFEPWVLMSGLTVLPAAYSGLDATKGIDPYLINKAGENNKKVEGLDTLDIQLDLLEFGDWDTQLAMTKDLLKELMDDPDVAGKEMAELYDTYLTYDENLLAEVMAADYESETEAYAKEYHDEMFVARNTAWANKFVEYLEQGGTTFIFAGAGHFVGEDSVFNIMKANNTLK